MHSKVIYIYNLKQANYYMQHGVTPIKTGIHSRTKKIYFVFSRPETEKVYAEWCQRAKTC